MKKSYLYGFIVVLIIFLTTMVPSSPSVENTLKVKKPSDTALEFWITEDVGMVDFSKHDEIYGWWGANQYLGKGYHLEDNINLPVNYVTYLITAYPDYADGGSFVTGIDITDPNVSVYELTTQSTLEEFDQVFKKMGYSIQRKDTNINIHIAEKNGITFTLGEGHLKIDAEISNREGIMF